MKKLPFYIALGVAVAAIIALALVEWKRRNQTFTAANIPQGEDYLFGAQSDATTLFRGFNMNMPLNANTHNGVAEITALQHMINAYYGTESVTVNGVFDDVTEAAIRDIENKGSTSLYEFTYMYLTPERGLSAATQILQALTQKS